MTQIDPAHSEHETQGTGAEDKSKGELLRDATRAIEHYRDTLRDQALLPGYAELGAIIEAGQPGALKAASEIADLLDRGEVFSDDIQRGRLLGRLDALTNFAQNYATRYDTIDQAHVGTNDMTNSNLMTVSRGAADIFDALKQERDLEPAKDHLQFAAEVAYKAATSCEPIPSTYPTGSRLVYVTGLIVDELRLLDKGAVHHSLEPARYRHVRGDLEGLMSTLRSIGKLPAELGDQAEAIRKLAKQADQALVEARAIIGR